MRDLLVGRVDVRVVVRVAGLETGGVEIGGFETLAERTVIGFENWCAVTVCVWTGAMVNCRCVFVEFVESFPLIPVLEV
jgi:hypothetical protein